MSENSSHQYTYSDEPIGISTSRCGRGGRDYAIKNFDPNDRDTQLPVAAVGEIGDRGAALMLGHFVNQQATEGSFSRDGWLMSGDLGALDMAGNLTVAGRSKDLIIRGGHKIHPAHIEAVALHHPEIDKIAAIALADERLGERICVVVVCDMPADVLLAHLRTEGLSKFDMPEYLLRAGQFLLTASGKVLKCVLVDAVRAGQLHPVPI